MNPQMFNNNNSNQNMNMNYLQKINNLTNIFNGMNNFNGNIDYNFKDNTNTLLRRIDSSIMIPDHQHPLYSCFTPQRQRNSQSWACRKCRCNYTYNTPSFYCTACDFDLCQKCLLNYPLYQIQMYDYSLKENFNVVANPNHLNYKKDIHDHIMALVQIENYNNDTYTIHCRVRRCDIRNTEPFYYCSLCNFYVCQNCFRNSQVFQNNNINNQTNFNNNMNQRPNNAFNPNYNNNMNQGSNNNYNGNYNNNNMNQGPNNNYNGNYNNNNFNMNYNNGNNNNNIQQPNQVSVGNNNIPYNNNINQNPINNNQNNNNNKQQPNQVSDNNNIPYNNNINQNPINNFNNNNQPFINMNNNNDNNEQKNLDQYLSGNQLQENQPK